ncbi:sensory transduction histidine kinase [Methanosarcina siciliae HI350]|uniref:Sensory transduction histidine kinase n=1 Tax=Methanosarcina siciliae HI350 TaxID=1434119 RepID=A0A0E3PAP5_9EURY|nr:histidine kinase dimerization/phosphoacceptor domain -containing protein [Methanosarcina siciliae]AKB31199.1 sensory transduction histidine kinase [Methanosarcina siciliae HI350]
MIAIIGLPYLIIPGNYLLSRTLVELFSVYVAYVIFLIGWKSRAYLENRYLIPIVILIGVAFFLIGSVDFLHALTFRVMGFSEVPEINLPDQFRILARYLESLSFLVALLFLIRNREPENKEVERRSGNCRVLKQREEGFRQKAIFLGDKYGHICRMIGVNRNLKPNNKRFGDDEHQENSQSFLQHFPGIGFQLDGNFFLVSIQGTVEEMTGYRKEDLLSEKVSLMELIVPEDQHLIIENQQKLKSNPKFVAENEFRIRKKNGELIWAREITQRIRGKSEGSGKFQGLVYDITERKMAEEALKKIDRVRIREVHHRIKNNLQVISSLLSLQAEKFEDREVIEAFRESQNRVASIAMIHEELHGGKNLDSLDFADYLQKLTADLFNSYRVGKDGVSLKLDLEKVYLGTDIAIPLGIIVNEMVSNSLKHAFSDKKEGEICINLRSNEEPHSRDELSGSNSEHPGNNCFHYTLTVADNGRGISEEVDFRNADSLGLQLITILVEQIGGCIELSRDYGTEFAIKFGNSGKCS